MGTYQGNMTAVKVAEYVNLKFVVLEWVSVKDFNLRGGDNERRG